MIIRKIMVYIGGIVLASAVAIAAMQVQINGLINAVGEIKETNKTLGKISLTLQKVFDSGQHRNTILRIHAKKQDALEKRQIYIFGEQKTRTARLAAMERHIDKKGAHR